MSSERDDMTNSEAQVRRILMQDIRTVDWGKQVAAFHFNTKLNHLVIDGCLAVEGWGEECEKLVSCLPPLMVTCGWRECLVDPFRGAREAFRSNRQGTVSDIPGHVRRMWEIADDRGGLGHTGLYHGNLLEILEGAGILEAGASRDFYSNILGMSSTPADSVEELIADAEGEMMLGNGELVELQTGGVFWRHAGGVGELWEETAEGTFLLMEGYSCICRWEVLCDGTNAVVIQGREATHTSVTNLGERVRDACRRRYGKSTRCHEFYERRKDEPFSNPCEIVGGEGEGAGWVPVGLIQLPCLERWLAQR